jgi:hypothetical protein
VIGVDTNLLHVSRVVREEKQQCWHGCAVNYRHSPTHVVSSYAVPGSRSSRKSKKIDVTTFLKRTFLCGNESIL